MGNSQEQVLRTDKFRQNKALIRKYTAVDGSLKKQIITAVEPVFLSPLVNHMTGIGQVSALNMIQHLFSSYGTIDEIYLEENAVKMMGTYNPTEPIARFIKQLKKWR